MDLVDVDRRRLMSHPILREHIEYNTIQLAAASNFPTSRKALSESRLVCPRSITHEWVPLRPENPWSPVYSLESPISPSGS